MKKLVVLVYFVVAVCTAQQAAATPSLEMLEPRASAIVPTPNGIAWFPLIGAMFDGLGDSFDLYATDTVLSGRPRWIVETGSTFSLTTPGIYQLVFSGFSRDREDIVALVFPMTPLSAEAMLPGRAPAFSGEGYWATGYLGTYETLLRRVSFANIPEPATLLLVSSGFLALAHQLRRRRNR